MPPFLTQMGAFESGFMRDNQVEHKPSRSLYKRVLYLKQD